MSAILGGAINSIAGGGTLLTFPALLAVILIGSVTIPEVLSSSWSRRLLAKVTEATRMPTGRDTRTEKASTRPVCTTKEPMAIRGPVRRKTKISPSPRYL